MANNILIQQGQILHNSELREIFKCSLQGGMRRSYETNSLVLISNHVKSIYDDKWENDIFHYVGTGRKGDQNFNFSQNKTLAESKKTDITVYLFEVFKHQEYTYQGIVELAEEPYIDKQLDENLKTRNVCVFPLKLVENTPLKNTLQKNLKNNENNISKLLKKLSNRQLKELIEDTKSDSTKSNNRTQSTISRPIRSKNIVLYTLRRANGICQLCQKQGPFLDKEGVPFLEVHHIVPFAKGGSDTIYNTAALCPNCHRKMHIIPSLKDITILKKVSKILLDDD